MAKLMMGVLFLVALTLGTAQVEANECLSVVSQVTACRNYLQNPAPITPGTQCCAAARNVFAGKVAGDGLCRCLRENPAGSGFIPAKAQRLASLCNLAGFSPLADCLDPSVKSAKNVITFPSPSTNPLFQLPPLPPFLPPLIPFLPPSTPLFPQLPPFLPPLTPFLPPLTPLLPPSLPIPPLIPGAPPAA